MSDMNPISELEEKIRRAMDVPNANPDFVNELRNELVRSPVKIRSPFRVKLVWAVAFVLALAVVILSMPRVAAAVGRLFGYVPEVGLVENTGNLRMLAEPASATRDGVTLLIKNVIVYADRVELSYEVGGIAPINDGIQAEDGNTDPTAFCGGMNLGDSPNKDGDARLRLPDGTLLERDYTGKYPSNAFAMKPVYEASVPVDVTEMALVLKCIPWARRGAVPENWEVPFKLKAVPAESVVGAPVIEVNQPTQTQPVEEPIASPVAAVHAIPTPVVKITLEKIVPMESATIFYLSMDMENKDSSLISIMPVGTYVIDSQGQKIDLIGNYVLQPFEHRPGSLFEFRSASKPADGPLTVVVENAVVYYAPLYAEPPQATPEEMSFTFDVGANPQYGQTWKLNNEFTIADYPLKVTSARAVTFEEIRTPDFLDGSQGYDFGYEFTIEGDPSVKMNIWMDIMSESPMCWLSNGASFVPSESTFHFTQLCREKYPNGLVKVTIGELSILLEHTWQASWAP